MTASELVTQAVQEIEARWAEEFRDREGLHLHATTRLTLAHLNATRDRKKPEPLRAEWPILPADERELREVMTAIFVKEGCTRRTATGLVVMLRQYVEEAHDE